MKKQGEGDAWQNSPIGGELTRAKATSAAMGYTLQATRTSTTYNQVKATVVAEIKNTGVAPFYATWPLEVILVDENNEIVTSQTIESTLPSILPDQTGKVTARLPLPEKFRSNDSAQELTAAFRVVNPLPGGARRLREQGHEQATARIPGPGEADPGPRAEELTTRPGSHTRGPGL